MIVPSGICAASLYIAVSPVVRMPVLLLNNPRGAACSSMASRSPSQKLRMITSGLAAEQRRDLGIELAGEQLGHLRVLDFDLRKQLLHRRFEVSPGILSPGVVLVEAGDRFQFRLGVLDVKRRADAVHGRGWSECETRTCSSRPRKCAACRNRRNLVKLLQFFGHRRDREAVAAGDLADHHVDVVRCTRLR